MNFRGDMTHSLGDVARRAKGLTPFLDAHGPDVSGPVVYVLEELAVDRLKVRKIVRAITKKVGILAELDNTCLDKIVLRVPQRIECLSADSVPQNAGARDEIALPVLLEITGVPGVWHSLLVY